MRRWGAVALGRWGILAGFVAGCARSSVQVGGFQVHDARAFEAKSGSTAAAYFTLVNHSDSADVLDSVTTRVARFASLHGQKTENGFVTMTPIDRPTIAAHDSLVLQPGGAHLMLESVDRDLTAGHQLPLTLWLHRAGRIDATATVNPYGS
ncbi:MAG: copper chaperone PCu(A)C [Gemmatimonadales bacterium]